MLVDAFIELKKEPTLKSLRLVATGGMTGGDKAFVESMKKKLAEHGYEGDATFTPAFDRERRLAFLKDLAVMSVPVPGGEAFGTHMLEALGCGVPVVQPREGGFPEVIEATGGGVTYDPEDPRGLVEALRSLLLDPDEVRAMGRRGQEEARKHFSMEGMVGKIADLYRKIAESAPVAT